MFSENAKIVPLLVSVDARGGADLDSINMAGYHKATIIVMLGNAGNTTLLCSVGATEGAKTATLDYRYAAGGAAIGTAVAGSTSSCDVLAAWAVVSSGTVTVDWSNKMVVAEVSSPLMAGYSWLTFTLTTTSAVAATAVAILEPRYTGNRSLTALK
jgi:hypothetical protein